MRMLLWPTVGGRGGPGAGSPLDRGGRLLRIQIRCCQHGHIADRRGAQLGRALGSDLLRSADGGRRRIATRVLWGRRAPGTVDDRAHPGLGGRGSKRPPGSGVRGGSAGSPRRGPQRRPRARTYPPGPRGRPSRRRSGRPCAGASGQRGGQGQGPGGFPCGPRQGPGGGTGRTGRGTSSGSGGRRSGPGSGRGGRAGCGSPDHTSGIAAVSGSVTPRTVNRGDPGSSGRRHVRPYLIPAGRHRARPT